MAEYIEVHTTEQLEKLLREQRNSVSLGPNAATNAAQPTERSRLPREHIWKLRAIGQRLPDVEDRGKSWAAIEHISRDSNRVSDTVDAGFGPQLRLASSAPS